MAIDLFRSLSDAELDGAIKSIALQLASGATQISSPDAGSASYSSRGDAIKTLRALEKSRARRLGLPTDPGDQIRITKVIARNDFYQR